MPRTLYHLAIYRPDKGLVFSASNKSLRESVRLAGLHVVDMDNYHRVVRELNRVPGLYAACFQLLPSTEGQEPQHQVPCFIILNSATLVGADFKFPPVLGGSPSLSSSSTSC
jgi:hypothetical protein